MSRFTASFTSTGRIRQLALAAAVTTTIAIIAGGVAYATIPDSGGVIHGCYQNIKGTLRVIDSSTSTCAKNETKLNWAQKGQPGPQGPQGPQGPAGLSGTSQAFVSTQPMSISPSGLPFTSSFASFGKGPTSTKVWSLDNLPAGNYVVTATGTVGNFADDSTQVCQLASGGSMYQQETVDTFHFPDFSDRVGASGALALTSAVNLPSTASVEVDCFTTDPSSTADGYAYGISITAVKVDTINGFGG
jgi:hypothetical protein